VKVLVPPLHLRINPDDPFLGDAYGRSQLAENLTRLIQASDDGLVLTIEGEWGTGKTSFIRMWKARLKMLPNFVPIYYDAFSIDFTDDPFVSLAASIYQGLLERVRRRHKRNEQSEQLKHLKKITKQLAIELAQMTAGLAVASLSSGFVSSGAVRNWMKRAFARLTFDTLKVNADAKFEAFLHSNDTAASFRSVLKDLLLGDEASPVRVVVFVDELDRCRPIFAVELIEKIKHLFNIPGVFFVLGVNMRQLLSTIQLVYGVKDIDAQIYLQKFVDFTTRLPVSSGVSADESSSQAASLIRESSVLLGLDQGPRNIGTEIDLLARLSGPSCLNLTPRAIEKAMSYISLSLHSCDDMDSARLMRFVVVGAFIRVGDEDSFNNLRLRGAVIHSGGAGQVIFKLLGDALTADKDITASNSFAVPGLREAARLIDMYEIPASASASDDEGVPAASPGSENAELMP
jgi:hypothetical protein